MSDEGLFEEMSSDDGDTDELIASSKKDDKPIAKKKATSKSTKKRLQKKSKIPDADNDTDSDDDFEEADDLQDSDDDDNGDGGNKSGESSKKRKTLKKKKATKPKKKKSKSSATIDTSKMSKRERMEALKAKKLAPKQQTSEESGERKKRIDADGKEKGYASGDSYESAQFVRTKEDDDFIDAEGEDPEALKELYAEQHFDDERPSGEDSDEEEGGRRRKKSKAKSKRARGPDALSDDELNGDEEPENPLLAAVHRMKKKKKEVKKLSELEDIAREFLERMDAVGKEDMASIKARKPAMKKLQMLPDVIEMVTKRDMVRPLLEFNFLAVAGDWIKPLPNGSLGNVTLRQKLLSSIATMTGEQGIGPDDLKKSGFGKVVMSIYMHKSETPAMKRQLKELIEQWSRPIFKKSGNLRDLERTSRYRGESGIAGFARANQAAGSDSPVPSSSMRGRDEKDLTSIISGQTSKSRDLGSNRVRVPYSKGFQFTVRPANRFGDVGDKRTRVTNVREGRDSLNRRMLEKTRPSQKNQRSANLSIEGRPTK